MPYPMDQAKLDRVRRMMADQEISALVVRSPDNVVYLTNYWPMKGYAVAVFPREGESTVVTIDPQRNDAHRMSWTKDVRTVNFYHPRDPRPPTARTVEAALEALKEKGLAGRVGIELSQGSQICDRMVGEPTVYTQGYFDAFRGAAREVVDATPLLVAARAIKTPQEIERMRLANELAALGMEYARGHIQAGMKESEVAAMIEGHIHSAGIGYKGVEMARAFTLVWSGPGIATFTATSDRPVQQNEPTLVEIWVVADGYWTDLTKNLCPGKLTPAYVKLLEMLLKTLDEAANYARDGASLGELDRLIRQRIAEGGYPGQPSHPVAHGVGARAHEPPFAHQALKNEKICKGMVLAIEPGCYWEGGGGLRLEDNYLITDGTSEKLCSYPDDFRV